MKKFTIIWLSLTPLVFLLADMERGYNATGGEIFFPLIPLLIYGFTKMKEDLKTW